MKIIISLFSLLFLITPLLLCANELETRFNKAQENEEYSREKAFEVYNELAEQGLLAAQMRMLEYHLNPDAKLYDFVEKQPEKGKRWLVKGLKANNPQVYFFLAIHETFEAAGLGVPNNNKDKDKLSINMFKKASEMGHPGAQFFLGLYYWAGQYGLDEDPKKAVELWEASAKQGYPNSYIKLMRQHGPNGIGVIEPDYQKVFEYAYLAYKKDFPQGFISLAEIYARGYRIDRNFQKALNMIEELDKKIAAGLFINYAATRVRDRFVRNLELVMDCDNKAKTVVFESNLLCVKRSELRANLVSMGLKVIREDDDYWEDVYDSSTILPGSKELRVTYTLDGYFAKAEYTIDVASYKSVLDKLNDKYNSLEEVSYRHFLKFEDEISVELRKPGYRDEYIVLRYTNEIFYEDVSFVQKLDARTKEWKALKSSHAAI